MIIVINSLNKDEFEKVKKSLSMPHHLTGADFTFADHTTTHVFVSEGSEYCGGWYAPAPVKENHYTIDQLQVLGFIPSYIKIGEVMVFDNYENFTSNNGFIISKSKQKKIVSLKDVVESLQSIRRELEDI